MEAGHQLSAVSELSGLVLRSTSNCRQWNRKNHTDIQGRSLFNSRAVIRILPVSDHNFDAEPAENNQKVLGRQKREELRRAPPSISR